MLLVVAIALTGSIVATGKVLSMRADDLSTEALTHEADSFHAFADGPIGRSETSVRGLLERYIVASVPDSGETFFTLIDGEPDLRSQVAPPARLDTDEAFIAKVAHRPTSTSGWWHSSAGKVIYGVIPVQVSGDRHRGSLIIVQFRDVQAAPLLDSWRVYSVVALIALVLAGLVSWLVAGRVLEPVRLVRRTAERITESDMTERIPITGGDDVARLAATFNRMLDRLEAAFGTQRRFIDDAGHELRTPITVIRGHLEVMGDNAEERAETTELVMDELDRMRRIVEELLDLARADRPDFIRPSQVNVTDLTVDALAHARVLAQRRWSVDEVAEGTIWADGQRLTQALMQLVSNAVAQTDQGNAIAIGSRLVGSRLLLWVRDDGPGVAASDRAQIFERFGRGQRTESRSGIGLGLAIVTSIAQAHGGTIGVLDAEGGGAIFVLDLPIPDTETTNEDGQ